SVNGVVVTRKNHTQITVSGKPKADANIALSDAVAKTIVIFDANGGKVNGLYTDTATTDTDGKLTSLPVPVRTNYRFDGWFTEKTGGKMVNEDYVFSESITIYAHWTHIGGGGGGVSTGVSTYNIEIEQPENGSLSASHTTAPGGTKITVTVTPDEGFEIDTVKVTDRNGKEIAMTKNDDGTYSFTMPNDSVNVTASFKEKAHDCPSAKFTDVDENAWYHEYIDYVVEKSLMQGIQDNLFAPNVTTSRAMIVTILYRLEGQPVVTGENPFDDVPIGVWYDSAVMWANANGIVEGYGNGKFGPKDLITREQFAAIMYRYANFKGYDTSKTADLRTYADVSDISDWAVPAVKWANAENLITGRTATTLVPRGNATRAEAAAILMRFIENIN
ncbi:MAG: S-layer homology domain-containing protein, partial [Firmicutes bacterium]|nr:S-layer homology domain-containing protein [Bacillota bacterium]